MNEQETAHQSHLEETHGAVSRLVDDHHRRTTPLQRLAARLTFALAQPSFLVAATVGVVLWVTGNILALRAGLRAPDPPPFNWLQLVASVCAFYVTILILTTQRREDELADRREHLALQLAIISEQKAAKTIALLEEMRRDAPALSDREDSQATAMAQSSGPQTVQDAIDSYARENPIYHRDEAAFTEP
jgi:uncharacterized membrane protein